MFLNFLSGRFLIGFGWVCFGTFWMFCRVFVCQEPPFPLRPRKKEYRQIDSVRGLMMMMRMRTKWTKLAKSFSKRESICIILHSLLSLSTECTVQDGDDEPMSYVPLGCEPVRQTLPSGLLCIKMHPVPQLNCMSGSTVIGWIEAAISSRSFF